MTRLLRTVALLTAAGFAGAAQLPLSFQRSDSNQLAPESSPAFITSDGFTTMAHPDFADHSIRIKSNDGWCDPDVKSFVGYLDNGPRHLYFYFFESRRSPDTDPLVLWTNGGPGCSSSMGLFMELGPCTTQPDGNSTKLNPHSWTNQANMIFIDQPVGVGFSYADSGVFVDTTEQAALDIVAFLSIFFETFPAFEGRETHLSGESYGGRYVPVFATEVLYHNSRLARKNSSSTPINLKSVIIGNGLTDAISMTASYYKQSCTSQNGLGKPILDVKQCIEIQPEVARCEKWLTKVCRTNVVQPECDIAVQYCSEVLEAPFLDAQINPYDISKPCTTLREDLCYPETSVIKTYLDQPWVRSALGVDKHIGPFQSCSNKVATAFAKTRDTLAPTFLHLTALLERDIKVLIYVGKYDWICNYIGNFEMLEALDWSGQAGFVGEKLHNWTVSPSAGKEEKVSGETKSFGGLTFTTVSGAGHMVPLDKPVEAQHMVESWLAGKAI